MIPAEQYRAPMWRKIDLGFVRFRARPAGNDLLAASVGRDTIMVAVAAGNPLAKKNKIDLKDLEPFFCRNVRKDLPWRPTSDSLICVGKLVSPENSTTRPPRARRH
jgi:hypothetical protein